MTARQQKKKKNIFGALYVINADERQSIMKTICVYAGVSLFACRRIKTDPVIDQWLLKFNNVYEKRVFIR